MRYDVGEDIKPIKVRIYHFMGWALVINGNSFNLFKIGI